MAAFTAVNTSLVPSDKEIHSEVVQGQPLVKKDLEALNEPIEKTVMSNNSTETTSTNIAIKINEPNREQANRIDLPNISNLSAHSIPLTFPQTLAPPPLPTTPLITVISSSTEPIGTSKGKRTENRPKKPKKTDTDPTISPTPTNSEISRASSVSTSTGGAYYHNNPFLYPQSRSRANPPLDFSALSNKANLPQDLDINPRPSRNRAFGLEEAPTLFPSAEEFKDPLKYISSLSVHGRKFGMIKIVPPAFWNPGFHLDTELFWFKTRRQNLNAKGGAEFVKTEFLAALIEFCTNTQRMTSPPKLPSIDKRPVDLYHLYECVKLRGGFQEVCKKKLWAQVGRELGYTGRIMTSLSTSLKSAYQRILLPYTEYLETMNATAKTEEKCSMNQEVDVGVKRAVVQNGDSPSKRTKLDNRTYSGTSPYSDRSKYPIITESESFLMRERRVGRKSILSSYPQEVIAESSSGVSNPRAQPWSASGYGVDESKRDLTEAPSYNLKQFQQKAEKFKEKFIERNPAVYNRLFNTNNVNTEEGPVNDKFSGSKAGNSREFLLNISKSNKENIKLSDELFEKDYWRVITENKESLEVEYGIDIHSAIHGSSFLEPERDILPDLNTPPSSSCLTSSTNVFSSALIGSSENSTNDLQVKCELFTDPWNLNILPINKDSPFRFIDTNVPGIVKPWMSIGMLFSTQCWGIQDHFTYEAQHHVFGDTITRYSIPEEDFDKYQELLEKVVDQDKKRDDGESTSTSQENTNAGFAYDAFRNNHNEMPINPLLESNKFITPQTLKENGIKCFALDHHPGQLVVTFPKAVTSHISHGFNLTERVQFATYDWLKDGKDSFALYKRLRQLPAFSFDKMILNMATNNSITISEANRTKYVAPLIKELCEEQKIYRDQMNKNYPDLKIEIETSDVEDTDYLCDFTKVYSYISRVVNKKSGSVYSPEYFLNNIGPSLNKAKELSSYRFVFRYEETALKNIYDQITQKTQKPCIWDDKYQKLLKETPRPELKTLKALLNEGESSSYYISDMGTLKSFILMADYWVKSAHEALSENSRKWSSILENDNNGKNSDDTNGDNNDGPIHGTERVMSIQEFQALLDQSYKLPFVCPEMGKLTEKAQNILNYQVQIRKVIADETPKSVNDLEQYKAWVADGETFGVELLEIKQLKRLIFRILWNERAKTQCEKYVSLDQIIKLIQEGLEAGVDSNDPILKGLMIKRDSGHSLEDKAKYFLTDERRLMFISDIDSLIAEATFQPVVSETLERLKDLKARYDITKNQINDIIEKSRHENISHRPGYTRVKNIINSSGLVHCESGVSSVKKGLKGVEDWMRIGKRIFGKGNASLNVLHTRIQSVYKRCRTSFSLEDTFKETPLFENRLKGINNEAVETHALTPPPPSQEVEPSGIQPSLFCLCRMPECGLMFECDNCHEWYHAKCLKLNRAKVKADGKFFCPICDWRLASIRDHESCRPPLEDLISWEEMAHELMLCPDELFAIQGVIKDAVEFRTYLDRIMADYNRRQLTAKTSDDIENTKRAELARLRHYLRKIEGADILLVQETNQLRLMVHQLDPIAPIPPKAVYVMQPIRKAWGVKNVSNEHLGPEFVSPDDNSNIDPMMTSSHQVNLAHADENGGSQTGGREPSTIRSLLND